MYTCRETVSQCVDPRNLEFQLLYGSWTDFADSSLLDDVVVVVVAGDDTENKETSGSVLGKISAGLDLSVGARED